MVDFVVFWNLDTRYGLLEQPFAPRPSGAGCGGGLRHATPQGWRVHSIRPPSHWTTRNYPPASEALAGEQEFGMGVAGKLQRLRTRRQRRGLA